jgi:hypothetical protein
VTSKDHDVDDGSDAISKRNVIPLPATTDSIPGGTFISRAVSSSRLSCDKVLPITDNPIETSHLQPTQNVVSHNFSAEQKGPTETTTLRYCHLFKVRRVISRNHG